MVTVNKISHELILLPTALIHEADNEQIVRFMIRRF